MAAWQLEIASGSCVVEGNSSSNRLTDAWIIVGRSRDAIWAGLRAEKVWRIFSASLVSSKRRFCLQATTGLAVRHISCQRLPGVCILPLKRPKWWTRMIIFIHNDSREHWGEATRPPTSIYFWITFPSMAVFGLHATRNCPSAGLPVAEGIYRMWNHHDHMNNFISLGILSCL